MRASTKNKPTKEQKLTDNIDRLLKVLNSPETTCTFWRVDDPHVHIMGIRPVKRTTIEIINENGFNPYDKKIEENLFKCFKIFINNNKNEQALTKEEINIKKEIENNGVIYIKDHDLIYIFDKVRKST
jgi:hypothetical protein